VKQRQFLGLVDADEFVEFQRFHDCDRFEEHFQAMTNRFAEHDDIAGVAVVSDREAAHNAGEPATWIQTEDGRRFWIHEYVPFDERVTTPEDFQAELEEIMTRTPDFDTLFEAAADIAEDLYIDAGTGDT